MLLRTGDGGGQSVDDCQPPRSQPGIVEHDEQHAHPEQQIERQFQSGRNDGVERRPFQMQGNQAQR